LALIEVVGRLDPTEKLQVRVGIDTGLVVGLADPVHAYGVVRLSAIDSRFEALHPAALTPLVGREEEVELLLRHWRQATKAGGRVVLLSGEPGIGKSRITAALAEKLRTEPHTCLRYFCSSYYTDSALHPTIRQLEHAAGFEREDSPAAKFDNLAALLARTGAMSDDVALLAELLSLSVAGAEATMLRLSPQQKKERTFATLARQVVVSLGLVRAINLRLIHAAPRVSKMDHRPATLRLYRRERVAGQSSLRSNRR
jgi:hypothetical protein